jgi:CRP/FNR family transcriptional regulator, cyclic AMP receptor protein
MASVSRHKPKSRPHPSSEPTPGYAFTHNVLTSLPRQELLQLVNAGTRFFLPKGKLLFKPGDRATGCYWLETGNIKASLKTRGGQVRILAILGPGSSFGELALLEGEARWATVEALEDCELTLISRAVFTEYGREYPDIYRHLFSPLVARLRQADLEMAEANFLTVKARVARVLEKLAEELGEQTSSHRNVIPSNIHQDDVAALSGVARESVCRTIAEWRKRKIVLESSGAGIVVDPIRLHKEVMDGVGK